MIKNEVLQKRVQDAIKWEPLLNAAEIGVTVKDGIVTLSGQVDSYIKKSATETAAKNVEGVKAVVEKIEIKFGTHHFKKDDNEIATDLVDALKWNWEVPNDRIHIKVENAWVTLDGELEWNYQKEAAKKAVSNQIGVLGVTNNLTIKSDMHDKIEKTNIELALNRNWSIDDKDISVVVTGNNVTLNGTVKSIYQSDESERIAWNAPGVWTVNNNLQIETTF